MRGGRCGIFSSNEEIQVRVRLQVRTHARTHARTRCWRVSSTRSTSIDTFFHSLGCQSLCVCAPVNIHVTQQRGPSRGYRACESECVLHARASSGGRFSFRQTTCLRNAPAQAHAQPEYFSARTYTPGLVPTADALSGCCNGIAVYFCEHTRIPIATGVCYAQFSHTCCCYLATLTHTPRVHTYMAHVCVVDL